MWQRMRWQALVTASLAARSCCCTSLACQPCLALWMRDASAAHAVLSLDQRPQANRCPLCLSYTTAHLPAPEPPHTLTALPSPHAPAGCVTQHKGNDPRPAQRLSWNSLQARVAAGTARYRISTGGAAAAAASGNCRAAAAVAAGESQDTDQGGSFDMTRGAMPVPCSLPPRGLTHSSLGDRGSMANRGGRA